MASKLIGVGSNGKNDGTGTAAMRCNRPLFQVICGDHARFDFSTRALRSRWPFIHRELDFCRGMSRANLQVLTGNVPSNICNVTRLLIALFRACSSQIQSHSTIHFPCRLIGASAPDHPIAGAGASNTGAPLATHGHRGRWRMIGGCRR